MAFCTSSFSFSLQQRTQRTVARCGMDLHDAQHTSSSTTPPLSSPSATRSTRTPRVFNILWPSSCSRRITASSSRSVLATARIQGANTTPPESERDVSFRRRAKSRAVSTTMRSCEKTASRFPTPRAYPSTADRPAETHSAVPKLTASPTLCPCENPAWYARGQVTTNSPGFCSAWNTSTPCPSRSAAGGTSVTSRCSKSGAASSNPGTITRTASSNASAEAPGTPYHVFGAPACR
mmetsp:Transcript_13274/g.56552  ORF Transcript_13274/g.56552 Transcript_13274/m.56552 type:complete len:236 (-) Transcript_13274:917-1624(-)